MAEKPRPLLTPAQFAGIARFMLQTCKAYGISQTDDARAKALECERDIKVAYEDVHIAYCEMLAQAAEWKDRAMQAST
jgi:hypothetical protein